MVTKESGMISQLAIVAGVRYFCEREEIFRVHIPRGIQSIPSLGDNIVLRGKEYTVRRRTWMVEPPAQTVINIYLEVIGGVVMPTKEDFEKTLRNRYRIVDVMLASYLAARQDKTPSNTSVIELLEWYSSQLQEVSDDH